MKSAGIVLSRTVLVIVLTCLPKVLLVDQSTPQPIAYTSAASLWATPLKSGGWQWLSCYAKTCTWSSTPANATLIDPNAGWEGQRVTAEVNRGH